MSLGDLIPRLQTALGESMRIERELEGGGMSRVFVGRDRKLGRDVIVKVLSPDLAHGVSLDRFEREIHTLARLQHPHIVPILDAGHVDGLPFYVMPYVRGESARGLLRSSGRLPLRDAVNILRDVAKALAFAHEQGVVHRDIKPDNILLSGNAAMVSDFGIAKAVAEAREPSASGTLTQVGTSVGTPAYMSPEQALGEPGIDRRTDIYAWGVTAYELLSGSTPFGNRTAQQMIRAHVSEAPAAITTQRAEIPAALASIVMASLEKEPGRRPASADALLAALDAAGHEPLSRKRGPARMIAVAAAVVLVAVAAWRFLPRDAKAATPAVAVLPFENLSGDTASEYFSDGMTEQLVSDLARAKGLRVASRAASFSYKGKHADPVQAAAAMHVDAIVTGSVRRAGDQLRVEAQLVDRDHGDVKWTKSFSRTFEDVFAIQDEIARAITSALRVSLVKPETHPSDVVAYDLYLRGKHRLAGGFTKENVEDAIGDLRRALQRDSTYAPAWGALSDAYRLESEFVTPMSVLPLAKDAARRAVELDPSDLSAGLALAHIIFNVDWNWAATDREYRRVLELHPDAPLAHRQYEAFLDASRRHDEALAHERRAGELEWAQATDTVGLRARQLLNLARVYGFMGQRDTSARLFEEAIRLNPTAWTAHWEYGLVFMRWDPPRAVRELELMRKQIGDRLPQLSHVGAAYGYAGRPDSTRRIIAELMRRSKTVYIPKDQLFVLYLSIGDKRTAYRWLREAVKEHHYWLPYINASNFTDVVRYDPEYRAILRSIGVPASAL